jgi:LysM repeat protein
MMMNPPKAFAYIVQSDDTLEKLAKRYETTVETIIAMNPMIDSSDYLATGQVIAMPGDPPSARGPRFEERRRAELERRRRRELERRRRAELERRRRAGFSRKPGVR